MLNRPPDRCERGRRICGRAGRDSCIQKLCYVIQTTVHLTLSRVNFMTNANRVTTMGLLVFMVAILGATSGAQTRPPIAEKLAKTYGLDSYGQIEAIRYTWSAQFPGVDVSRTWTWEPKTGQVTYEGKDKDGKPVKVTYLRSQLSSQPANVKEEVDPAFMNDQYWLVFPFHVIWDT